MMSTQILDEAARLLGAQVLVDDLLVGDLGEPVTTGINVTRDIDFYGPTTEQRRNWMPCTSMQNFANAMWGQFGAVASTLTRTAVITPDGEPGVRQTLATVTGAFSIALYGSRNNGAMPVGFAGDVWVLGIRVRASKPGILDLSMSYGAGSVSIGATAFAIGTDPVDIFLPVTVAGAAIGQILSMRLGLIQTKNPAWGVGDWVEYSDPLFTEGPWATPFFFDGDSGDSATDTFYWSGVADQSSSVLATRALRPSIKGLVQSVTLENANEGRVTQVYSIKVARGTALEPGQAVKVLACAAEPDLTGKVLLVDQMSLNGVALIRKGTASTFQTVQEQGKGVLA